MVLCVDNKQEKMEPRDVKNETTFKMTMILMLVVMTQMSNITVSVPGIFQASNMTTKM